MASGPVPSKILDLRPYLESRPAMGRGNGQPEQEEDNTQELLDDSPDDFTAWEGAAATGGQEQWVLMAGSAAIVAAVGGSALAFFLPPAGLTSAIPVLLGASMGSVWLNHRLLKRREDFPQTTRRRQVENLLRLERNDLVQTITALAVTLEARDPYTKDHSRHVARLSVQLGRRLGLNRDELYEIHLAGLLHDIGKIGIPDQILLKPSRLTDEEMRIVRSHVLWSYDILSTVRGLRSVAVIARHHHERFDGMGYPDALAGAGIPMGARVMAVADMFMAMTEDRPYRKGLPIAVAVEELHNVSGCQLDPRCVSEFLLMLEEEGAVQPAEDSDSKSAAAN